MRILTCSDDYGYVSMGLEMLLSTGNKPCRTTWSRTGLLEASGTRLFSTTLLVNFWTLVHGDDYCSAGVPSDLDWMQSMLADKYDI